MHQYECSYLIMFGLLTELWSICHSMDVILGADTLPQRSMSVMSLGSRNVESRLTDLITCVQFDGQDARL